MRHASFVLCCLVVMLVLTGCESSEDGDGDTGTNTDMVAQDTNASDVVGSDTAVGGGECRSNADCMVPGEECQGPNPHAVCGIAPQEGCFTSADCATDMVCSSIHDSCSRDGYGSQCMVACTTDEACGGGLRCGAGGACEALPCDDPVSDGCPAHQVCAPSQIPADAPVYDQHDGCFDIPCSSDAECDAALVCVTGRCQQGPGTCIEPMLVP